MQTQTEIRTQKIIQHGLQLAATEGVAHAWVYLVANDIPRHTVMGILAHAGHCTGADAQAEAALS